ncbi:MAG: pantetheine-phosphate adenylyltransferase [Oscillospiraceae bacterium]|jgi:pantetheine-phosphate adenylyltransferase|nr:pantetheine-phosphate adenylyltransferase [Oscillospiraceae bacterium]MBR4193653.1 pantetheine-phosphate adenylyltransferase [Oscillospiraceae bacterium]
MGKTAIYPGSFDPFTNGHLDIVRKACDIFDRVWIVIGVNAEKRRSFSAEKMAEAIVETLNEEGLSNFEVVTWDGLVAEYARRMGTAYMIRGLRNNMDYNYEENVAAVNKLINPELEYVYFRSNNVAVSSSMVKELYSYGKDVSQFVPKAVLTLLN